MSVQNGNSEPVGDCPRDDCNGDLVEDVIVHQGNKNEYGPEMGSSCTQCSYYTTPGDNSNAVDTFTCEGDDCDEDVRASIGRHQEGHCDDCWEEISLQRYDESKEDDA